MCETCASVCRRAQACPGVPGRVHPQAGVCIHRRACASTGGRGGGSLQAKGRVPVGLEQAAQGGSAGGDTRVQEATPPLRILQALVADSPPAASEAAMRVEAAGHEQRPRMDVGPRCPVAHARRKWHAVVEMLRVVARLVRRIGGAGRLNAQLGCVLEDLACRCDAGQGRRTKRVSSQACCIERPLRGSYSEVRSRQRGMRASHCSSGAPQRGCARWARRCEAAQENDHGHPAASRRSRWIAGLGSWVANRLSKAKSPPIRVPTCLREHEP